ncbi:MAG TPA: PAS domain S-box protein [Polyangiaceae bacterium]|nr:PAS domain S-box protein [Polyangiaceae bacterium]
MPARKPLVTSSDSFATAFEVQAVPALVTDKSYRILLANRAALDFLGYERSELEGLHVEDLVPVELRERYRKLRSMPSEGSAGVLLRGERIVRTRLGREVAIELAITRALLDGVEYRVATLVDLSRQKESEQESIERLSSIVEHADVGVFLVQVGEDGAFVFESFNSVTEKLTGLTRDQARGRGAEQVVPPAEAARVIAKYARAVELGTPYSYEEVGDTALGLRTFRTTLVPIRNRSGRVHRLIGLSYDITDQRHAEDALAVARRSLTESEEKFKKAFAASPHPISITDLPHGRLIEVNDAVERVFGYAREESLGKTTVELGMWRDPAERKRMVSLLREVGSFRDFEMAGADRHGRPLSLVLSGEIVSIGDEKCVVTYVQDVTERETAKRALIASRELFAKAFQASPDAYIILEAKSGCFVEVNEGFERLFLRTRAEVVGRTSLELDLWSDALARERSRAILFEKRSLRDFPIVARRKDGSLRECLMSAEHLELASGRSVLAVVRDVTEKLATERAKAELEAQLRQAQKMDALGTLAGGIAHDFNNILGAILAYSELIKLDIDMPQQIEAYLVELRRAGERAKDLVQQILTFSRRQPQARRPIRVETAVRDALNLLRSTLPSTLRIDVRIGDAPLVLADPTQIHQVITNLGTNAAHAMRLGPGVLTVELVSVVVDADGPRAHAELEARRYARLTVKDNGEGMPPETLKHIFEPFFTTKSPGEGTGLGLAVVHGIVREHEGAIFVESEPGRGTTFTLYLPEHEVTLEDALEPPAELVRANGESVLFIDDEAVLCRAVAGLLERLGYRVTARSDPTEALELFRRSPRAFDVVLTDLTMPGLTGVDVAREVLKLAPRKPVLVMSGFNSTWTADGLKALGVVDLISKPLGAVRLSESLAAALGKGETRRGRSS